MSAWTSLPGKGSGPGKSMGRAVRKHATFLDVGEGGPSLAAGGSPNTTPGNESEMPTTMSMVRLRTVDHGAILPLASSVGIHQSLDPWDQRRR